MSEIKYTYKTDVVQPNAPEEQLALQAASMAPKENIGAVETVKRAAQETFLGNWADTVEEFTSSIGATKFNDEKQKNDWTIKTLDSFNSLRNNKEYTGWLPTTDQLTNIISEVDSASEFGIRYLNLKENEENRRVLDTYSNQFLRYTTMIGIEIVTGSVPGTGSAKVARTVNTIGKVGKYTVPVVAEAAYGVAEMEQLAKGEGRDATTGELLAGATIGIVAGGLEARSILKEERIAAAVDLNKRIDDRIKEGLEQDTETLEQMNIQMEQSKNVNRSVDEDGNNTVDMKSETIMPPLNQQETAKAHINGTLTNNVQINTDITNAEAANVINATVVPKAQEVSRLQDEINNIEGSIANVKADLKEAEDVIRAPIQAEIENITSKMSNKSERASIDDLIKEAGSLDEVTKANKKEIDRLAGRIRTATGKKSIKEITSADDIENAINADVPADILDGYKAKVKTAKQLEEASKVDLTTIKKAEAAKAKLPEEHQGKTVSQLKAQAKKEQKYLKEDHLKNASSKLQEAKLLHKVSQVIEDIPEAPKPKETPKAKDVKKLTKKELEDHTRNVRDNIRSVHGKELDEIAKVTSLVNRFLSWKGEIDPLTKKPVDVMGMKSTKELIDDGVIPKNVKTITDARNILNNKIKNINDKLGTRSKIKLDESTDRLYLVGSDKVISEIANKTKFTDNVEVVEPPKPFVESEASKAARASLPEEYRNKSAGQLKADSTRLLKTLSKDATDNITLETKVSELKRLYDNDNISYNMANDTAKRKTLIKRLNEAADAEELSKEARKVKGKLPDEYKELSNKKLEVASKRLAKEADDSSSLVKGNKQKVKDTVEALAQYNKAIALRAKISKVVNTDELKQSATDLRNKINDSINEDQLVKDLKSDISKLEAQRSLKKSEIMRKEKEVIQLEEEFQNLMKNPDEVYTGVRKEVYNSVKEQIERLQISKGRQSMKEAMTARKGAEEAGDTEVMEAIDDSYYVDEFKVGDFTAEEQADLVKIEENSEELARRMKAEREFVDNVIAEESKEWIKPTGIVDDILEKSIGKVFDVIGYALPKSAEGKVRALSLRLVRNPLGNADGSVSTLAATDFKDQFVQKYGLRMDYARREGFFAWAKEKGINVHIAKKAVLESFDDYKAFNDELFDYLSKRDNPATFGDGTQFSKAVRDAGERIAEVSKEMDLDVTNASKFLTEAEAKTLRESAGKAVLPRVRDDEAYKYAMNNFDEATIIKVHEGALLKGNPLLNHNVEINRLKNLKNPTTKQRLLLEKLEADRDIIQKSIDNGTVNDDIINDIMNNWEGKRYSDYLAEQYYRNQRHYAFSGKYEERGAIIKTDLDSVMNRVTGRDDKFEIPEDVKEVLRLALGKETKAPGKAATDSLLKRVDMDINHSIKFTDGRELKMSDFFIKDVDGAMGQKVNRFSGEYGVRMKGYSGLDEVNKEIDDTMQLSTVSDRDRRMLDKVKKNLNGVAQYDQSGRLAGVVRTIKNLAAYLRLGTLFISVGIESVNLIAHHGISDYLKAIKPARQMYKAMLNGELTQAEMNGIAMHGGISFNPISNFLRRDDAGAELLTGQQSGIDRALVKAQNVSATLAKGTQLTYQGLDTTIRIMSAQLSLSKVLDASVDQLSDVRMADAGFTEDMITKIQAIKGNSKYVTRYKDGSIKDVDIDAIIKDDHEFGNSLVASIVRLGDKAVMTTRFSDMPDWYNTSAFFYLGQFRAFMIGSFTNALRYGVRRPDAVSAKMFTFQMALQGIYYHAKIQHLRTENPEEYEAASSPEGYFFGTLRMTPQGAMLTTLFDMFTGGVFGREFGSTYGSNTGQKGFGWESTTVTKSIDDWVKNITNGVQGITGADEYTDADFKRLRNSILPNIYNVVKLFNY